MTPPELYIPTYAIPLNTQTKKQQIRLGLQGFPKVGKTFAALTFPNPVVLDFDRGLGAHQGRADVIAIPFYDDAFVDGLVPRIAPFYMPHGKTVKKIRPANRKDALVKWLYEEAPKFSADQTLIIDGNTTIQAAYHAEYWTAPELDQQSKIKPYVEFRQKIDYFTEVFMCLKALKCNVVYIAHESDARDDKGNLNGKIRPLMSGAIKDEIMSHFTDWFRCYAYGKPTGQVEVDKATKFFGVDKKTMDEWSTFSNNETMYLWQTTSDADVDCGTSSLDKPPKWIPAHFSMFEKYRRKIS